MISFVLPTRDRPATLAGTLASLGALPRDALAPIGGAEVVVVDNASSPPASTRSRLENGLEVRLLRRETNEGAAARNVGAEASAGAWLVMLDDDSYPEPEATPGLVDALREAGPEVAAIGAEIVRPDGRREAGGLPEVIVGCGAAVRRAAFLDVGGYDATFGYYVEEYDLCAKLLAAGGSVRHDRRFRVRHLADPARRCMDLILERLVRNNGWVIQRYAPEVDRVRLLLENAGRYAAIAVRESAAAGYAAGLGELLASIDGQARRPLGPAAFDRFTGLAAVRRVADAAGVRGRSIAVVDGGKNEWAVRAGLDACGARITDDERAADALAIGTLSPGTLWDAWERRDAEGAPLLPPWIE